MTISQAAQLIGTFTWNAADPVSLAWRVDVDWSGEYLCQVRKTRKPTGVLVAEMSVTAVYDTPEWPGETLFVMSLSKQASAPVLAGRYYTDIQQVGGVTRLWGKVKVEPQVTEDP